MIVIKSNLFFCLMFTFDCHLKKHGIYRLSKHFRTRYNSLI